MSYKIKPLQYAKAKELGVNIAPSKNPNKKVDVFIGDKKVASIGANKSSVKGKPMMDYATYLKEEPAIAEKRRENYIKRHSKEKKINEDGEFTKSFYSDEILWGKKKDDVNTEIKKFKAFKTKLLKEQEKKKKAKVKKDKKK